MIHTPGPWTVSVDDSTYGRYSLHTPELNEDGPEWIGGGPASDMDDANARLIGAAPDLIRAAKAMLAALESVDFSPLTNGTYDQIPWAVLEQAIAKAEGRDSDGV